MNVPPLVIELRISRPDASPFHLWLPLFLLWPLVFALGALALVATIAVDTVLYVLGRRYHHYSLVLLLCFEALAQTRGMVLRFSDNKTAFDMTLQ